MVPFKMELFTVYIVLGIVFKQVAAQALTTKCPNNEWTKIKERCYLPVQFSHSWLRSYNFCQKFGARLVEPAGYSLTSEIHQLVKNKFQGQSAFWTGYNRINSSSAADHEGYWSNGQKTTQEVGVWGQDEPKVSNGNCARVSLATARWHMTKCDSIIPFVCEIDPCPAGTRDTFMCNGRCLGTSLVCDGKDDCGNNADEENCPSQSTYAVRGGSGDLSQVNYTDNANMMWVITSESGTRINVQFLSFNTEADTDFLEFWDGGPTLSTSRLATRVSGIPDTQTLGFISSYNFLIVKFVTDQTTRKSGFSLKWTTNYTCSYSTATGSYYSNTGIEYSTLNLTSLQNATRCKDICNTAATCLGFAYRASSNPKVCHLINLQPILTSALEYTVFMKTCPPGSTSSMPMLNSVLTATSSPKQLTTPLYPNPYVGNLELEYMIRTDGNNLITLQILQVNLCCNDYIHVYDKGHDLLATLESNSSPGFILSTSNVVYVRMDLHTHWKCSGALIQYTKGCNVSQTGSGELSSPGYSTPKSYPPLSSCQWRINSPSADRSVTVIFNDFQLHTSDKLMVTYSNGSHFEYTGTSLRGRSLTSNSHLLVTMTTSSLYTDVGFKATFSPGCPSLVSNAYTLDMMTSNYGDTVLVSCADGYTFTGKFAGLPSVNLTCLSGGHWSEPSLPVCQQGFCGFPPLISNGYIVSSTGIYGGDKTTYKCKNGYLMNGAAVITCQENNVWQTQPQCTAARCPDLNATAIGVDSIDTTTSTGMRGTQGSVVRVSCSAYREVLGPQLLQCNNGSWDYTTQAPVCTDLRCETPVIANAYLAPTGILIKDQIINVTCKEGYKLVGNSTFRCGVTNVLPMCAQQECTLPSSAVVSLTSPSRTVYQFGDDVRVACSDGYVLDNFHTTNMSISCLSTGQWNIVPMCRRMDCRLPPQVKGSIYNPAPPCVQHNCAFEFSCSPMYELQGESYDKNNTVRCGAETFGVWGFGKLHCLGGQCPDPGYPADGHLVGDSFLEGARVTFACDKPGYEPWETVGGVQQPSSGMTCVYRSDNKSMVWKGVVPTCIDREPPKIYNCGDNGGLEISTENLEPTTYLGRPNPPFALDNNAVKTWTVSETNFRFSQPVSKAGVVTYTAVDFAGNATYCLLRVTIPKSIECQNDKISELPAVTGTIQLSGDDPSYFQRKVFGGLNVTFKPQSVSFDAVSSSLYTAQEIMVTSRSSSGNLLDTCTLQFRVKAPSCAQWQLKVPNGNFSCSSITGGIECQVFCNAGFYFMEAYATSIISINCTSNTGLWNRDPPVCASSTEQHLIYVAMFSYKYMVASGVTDAKSCTDAYSRNVRQQLEIFANNMESVCNTNLPYPGNELTLSLRKLIPDFNLGTIRLSINFEFLMVAINESLNNTQAVKSQCAQHIQTVLNSQERMQGQPIANLSAIQGSDFTCGAGTFDLSTNSVVDNFACEGNRQYGRTSDSKNVCLECPLGYYYEHTSGTATATHRCLLCPSGTYGITTANGTECAACPDGLNPSLRGQTEISSCYLKGQCGRGEFSKDGLAPCKKCPKGYFSAGILARTCHQCDSNQVTLQVGSYSSTDCLTLSKVEELTNETLKNESPCHPNPCLNNGSCSYVRSDYFCSCKPGYTGDTCQSEFNACTSHPCKNGGRCVVDLADPTKYLCTCEPEFSGANCEADLYGCAPYNCRNNGTCHNSRNNHVCICPSNSGYTGGTCENLRDPCLNASCVNGFCKQHHTFYRSCVCHTGYTGLNCESDINDCLQNPCQNNATCVDLANGLACVCLDGYYGDYCQFHKACDVSCTSIGQLNCRTCVMNNTQQCTNVGNSFTCGCKPGFKGTSCEIAINDCNSFPCQHGGTCMSSLATGYICSCLDPWTGLNCESMVNKCPNGNSCFNGGTCFSTTTGYVCSCLSTFIGTSCNESYDLCERTEVCVGNNSTCSIQADGNFKCNCQDGRMGTNCQEMVTSCTADTCHNGASCSISPTGQVVCTCAQGFTGTYCDTNMDDCVTDPCSSNQQCVDGVNSHTCVCRPGYRGETCSKTTSDFDYIIQPSVMCRDDVSMASYGDGTTLINTLTVAFWVRFTVNNPQAVILNVFGSDIEATSIPESPAFHLQIAATYVQKNMPGNDRKKRAVETIPYKTLIVDGYWHHITVGWNRQNQELSVYVDSNIQDQMYISLTNRGFVVFGDFDPVTGTSRPQTSFEGRISRLVVSNDASVNVQGLYKRTASPTNILRQERSLMLMYPVDYNSELRLNKEKCLPGDTACHTFAKGVRLPTVTSCPDDILTITSQLEAPTWVTPTFNGSEISPPLSNVQADTQLDWGVHGIVYAAFDTLSNAAVCTFRLYNRGSTCNSTTTPSLPNNCDQSVPNIIRCPNHCVPGKSLAGVNTLYRSCSMYGMWDEAFKYTKYIYPTCTDSSTLTQKVTLSLLATPSVQCGPTVLAGYRSASLNALSVSLNAGNQLCGQSCNLAFNNAITCDGTNQLKIEMDFGYLKSQMSFNNSAYSPEDILRIAVGDLKAFTYVDPNNNSTTVTPDLTTFSVSAVEECGSGLMVASGQCVGCGPGTEYSSAIKTCVRCSVGQYKEGSQGDLCVPCQPGLTTEGTGASSVNYCEEKCRVGTYFNTSNLVQTCVECPVGFYQDEVGQFTCKPCTKPLTTGGLGSISSTDCKPTSAFTTTPAPNIDPPDVGKSSEGTSLGAGEIVAIVIGVLLFVLIIILILCFCCLRDILPCFKKKPLISPAIKDGYHAKKYGQPEMQFINYNLKEARERNGKSVDKFPIMEPQMSDETGSVRTDISVHIPQKQNGSWRVLKKSHYLNGGDSVTLSLPNSARANPVMTSSPRASEHLEDEENMYNQPKKSRKKRKSKSGERRSRRHRDEKDEMETTEMRISMPKALAPLPQKLKSTPPSNTVLRPSSALEQSRTQIGPEQYSAFLRQSPEKQEREPWSSHRSKDGDRSRSHEEPERSSRHSQRSRDEGRSRSYDDVLEEQYEEKTSPKRSKKKSRRQREEEEPRLSSSRDYKGDTQEMRMSTEGDRSRSHDEQEKRSFRDSQRSRDQRRSKSYDDDDEQLEEKGTSKKSKNQREEEPRLSYSGNYFGEPEVQAAFNIRRIQVESDDDLA